MKDVDFDRIRREWAAEQEADYDMTPERKAYLEENYPKDTPEAYKKIKPEEFFDGD